ncbi:MAG: DUF1513 domain-containing protein, partial [Rhodospirillaceae bacterium]
DIPVPERYHGAAVHPSGRALIGFARRPGITATVLDLPSGTPMRQIDAPSDRHFYGHGAFAADGSRLWVPENQFDAEDPGVIGVLDPQDGYRRIGSLPAHGIGPHEVALCPATGLLVVANGGIRTHPDLGRVKLNIGSMAPSLVHLDPQTGRMVHTATLPERWHHASIRHLAIAPDGTVVLALQWEGEQDADPPLVALLRPGETTPQLPEIPPEIRAAMRLYCGSAALDASGTIAAVSAPKGGVTVLIRVSDGQFLGAVPLPDGCGVAALGGSQPGVFLATSGAGQMVTYTDHDVTPRTLEGGTSPWWSARRWDNHLIQI